MTMTYDELERLVTKTLPDIVGKDESVTYTYDTCTLGIGRLCTRSDDSGDYAFTYDAFGNIVSMSKTELGVTYVQQYQYDDGDNVTQMTLPSGRVVDITRDGVRRVSAIDTALNGSAQNVLNNIEYRADNQITRRVFGNGVADDRQYDLQGRLQAQQLTGSTQIDTRDYTFDKNSNIVSILGNAENNTYTYDALDRVTSDTIDGGDAIDFTYDLNDNRLTEDAEGFDYMVFSNRLETRTETGSGLTFTSLNREMTYNAAGRLFQVLHDGVLTAEYVYNDNGQRTRKAVHDGLGGTTTTVYHYDIFGHLISETDELGTLNKDYIWLENLIPVAQIDNTGTESISYLHTDHLLTARIATDNSQAVIWRWEGEAFGGTEATELSTIAVNLRFPGQYFDDETNLHYNHFRYYDPTIGRYITSDPIGLFAGFNTYNYGNGVVGSLDPLGLDGFNIGFSTKLAGTGVSLSASYRFPGITHERRDLQLKIGLTPGLVGEEIIKRLDPENPFAESSGGFDVGKLTFDIGIDTDRSESGIQVVETIYAGAELYGVTFESSELIDANELASLAGGMVNFGPQLRAGSALELQLTGSVRKAFEDVVNTGRRLFCD